MSVFRGTVFMSSGQRSSVAKMGVRKKPSAKAQRRCPISWAKTSSRPSKACLDDRIHNRVGDWRMCGQLYSRAAQWSPCWAAGASPWIRPGCWCSQACCVVGAMMLRWGIKWLREGKSSNMVRTVCNVACEKDCREKGVIGERSTDCF